MAATGWLVVGLAPITIMQSESFTAVNGAETAPDPTHSIKAATEDAWHNLVQ